MSLTRLRIVLWSVPICWMLNFFSTTLSGQPACIISGGTDHICQGSSTNWIAPEGMTDYLWTGPGGFTSAEREVTISVEGNYSLSITNAEGTSTCQRHLYIYTALSPGTINVSTRQFCTGGTAPIGGTYPPYGPATGGSGNYVYTWQLQEGCNGTWIDIPGTNTTSYTPVSPTVTTCYRRKVTDAICNTEAYTDAKRFEMYDDPVSQTIVPLPANLTTCSGTPVSATFTGGSGGFPGGTTDIYEFSVDAGATWSAYVPAAGISTDGLSGTNIIRVRTRRIPTGVSGCNWGSYVSVSWSVNPLPVTSPIYHR